MTRTDLVSVVVPAFNAEATLAATLASVRAQSYGNLEIVVVDDGSTDGTRALAEAAAREDPRIRVLAQSNAGLPAARNAGIRAAGGAFLAPVDADDIWHPEKIARQMAAMAAGGPEMGFVYTGYRRVDSEGRALPTECQPFLSGRVFLRHLLVNFVGNGSSLLIRRAAFDAVGGYEPAMPASEDHLFQILVARAWSVGVVPEHLTGYRQSPGSMSSRRDRMLAADLKLLGLVRARHPETPADVLAAAEAAIRSRHGVFQVLAERRLVEGGGHLWRAFRRAPAAALPASGAALRGQLRSVFRRRVTAALRRPAPTAPFPPFLALDPALGNSVPVRPRLERRLQSLEAREEAFFRSEPAKRRG